MHFFHSTTPTKNKRVCDLPNVKPLYEAVITKHNRLKTIVGRPNDLDEFEALKVDLDSLYSQIAKHVKIK